MTNRKQKNLIRVLTRKEKIMKKFALIALLALVAAPVFAVDGSPAAGGQSASVDVVVNFSAYSEFLTISASPDSDDIAGSGGAANFTITWTGASNATTLPTVVPDIDADSKTYLTPTWGTIAGNFKSGNVSLKLDAIMDSGQDNKVTLHAEGSQTVTITLTMS